MEDSERQKSYFQNWISVIGRIGSVFFFAAFLFLVVLDFFAKEANPYLGVVTYLALPIFLIANLLLIPFGAFRERARRHRRGFVRRFPQIDFNNPTHQKWAFATIGVVTLFLLFTAFGTYRAYEFTESAAFCGRVCHEVMEPEYTAYHNSPHARVPCADCHIGPGASWFVRSKLSGSYQVYSVAAKRFSRPIETPIKNLRPAQETCEQCHWPRQFFGAVQEEQRYFLTDESNTEWNTRMLIFVGGGVPPFGKKEGIHWHMNINNQVYYAAADEKRQKIPWVKKINPDGKEEIYVDEESEYSAASPPKGELRKMDCMDCHNRPSHNFKSPSEAVNEAMAVGAVSPSLPFIKREAVKALIGEYESHKAASQKIRERLETFYAKKYPDVYAQKKNVLEHSIHAIIEIYKANFFPAMKVSWKEYPDDIGHMIFPGCFRCHSGRHKTEEGKMIATDCRSCHSIIAQGPAGAMEAGVDGLEFKHPDKDTGEAWKEMACFDCHTGDIA